MISWDENLRTTSFMSEKVTAVKSQAVDRKFEAVYAYAVAFPTNEANLLDIYNMGELYFRYYRDSSTDIHIIGLAESKAAAFDLVKDIVTEVSQKTGGTDVKGYFMRRLAIRE